MKPTLFTPRQIQRQGYIAANIEVIQRVDGFTPCWEWSGTRTKLDYGTSTGGGKDGSYGKAYRASYMAFVGAIPPRYQIDHLCMNRPCVNPEHLEAVTARVNVQRAIAHHKTQGTGSWNVLAVCAKGIHPMAPENVSIAFSGGREHRSCKACMNARVRQDRAKDPARFAAYSAAYRKRKREATALAA